MRLKDQFPYETDEDFYNAVSESLTPEEEQLLDQEMRKAEIISANKFSVLSADHLNQTVQNEALDYLSNEKLNYLSSEELELKNSWSKIASPKVRLLLKNSFHKPSRTSSSFGLSLLFEVPINSVILVDLVYDFLSRKGGVDELFLYLTENTEFINPTFFNKLRAIGEVIAIKPSRIINLSLTLISDSNKSLEEKMLFANTAHKTSLMPNGSSEEQLETQEVLINLLNQLRIKHDLADMPDLWVIEALS